MEPQEIFELIVKADEKLKYATSAREAARAIGNDPLVQQAELRLTDLDDAQL